MEKLGAVKGRFNWEGRKTGESFRHGFRYIRKL